MIVLNLRGDAADDPLPADAASSSPLPRFGSSRPTEPGGDGSPVSAPLPSDPLRPPLPKSPAGHPICDHLSSFDGYRGHSYDEWWDYWSRHGWLNSMIGPAVAPDPLPAEPEPLGKFLCHRLPHRLRLLCLRMLRLTRVILWTRQLLLGIRIPRQELQILGILPKLLELLILILRFQSLKSV